MRKGEGIWPEIKRGLEAPDEMTRFWTLGVLSEVIVPAARPALAALLDDPEIRVRAAAAYALGAQRDKAVTKWLIKALADKAPGDPAPANRKTLRRQNQRHARRGLLAGTGAATHS